MKQRKNKNPRLVYDIAIPIVTTLLGITLKIVYEKVFAPTPEDPALIVVILTAFMLIGAFITLLVGRYQTNLFLNSQKEIIDETTKAHQDLIKKFGVSARLHPHHSTSQYKNPFEYPTPLIENATSIIALDYHDEETVSVESDQKSEYAKWYELINRVIREKKDIEYKRILQLRNGAIEVLPKNDHYDPTVIKHYNLVIQANKTNKKVRLITCPIFLSRMCVMIIDYRYVIWELPVINDDTEFHFDIDLVIEDPEGSLVNELLDEINVRLEENSKLVTSIA